MAFPASAVLSVVTERPEVRRAYRSLKRQLERGAQRVERRVGFQGGSAVERLLWRPEDGFWALLDEGPELSHYWCAYGVDAERPATSHSIVCEINSPHEGFDRRCAGLFLKDLDGNFYLAHTGKVGGGRKGVGKSTFLRDYDGHLEPFHWPDGRADRIVVIGRIGASHFPGQLGRFVREVRDFKAAAKQTQVKRSSSNFAERVYFAPEFRGSRTSYEVQGPVEARCNHGLVVDALRAALERDGLEGMVGNDQHRDLFVATARGSRAVLFEVKTDLSTTSLYTGIGQLMLHGAKDRKTPTRVLVLPGSPIGQTRTALKRMGIHVLNYDWVDSRPVLAPKDVRRVLAAN